MTQKSKLNGIHRLLNHARKKIDEIEMDLMRRNSTQYKIIIERDPDGNKLYKIKPAFDNIRGIDLEMHAMEAVNALRSSLDHIVFALSEKSSLIKQQIKHICFPISKDAADWKTATIQACAHVDDIYIKIFEAAKPYKDGNDILWTLHNYWNFNKHRNIVSTSITGLHQVQGILRGGTTMHSPLWDYEKEEMIWATCSPTKTGE